MGMLHACHYQEHRFNGMSPVCKTLYQLHTTLRNLPSRCKAFHRQTHTEPGIQMQSIPHVTLVVSSSNVYK